MSAMLATAAIGRNDAACCSGLANQKQGLDFKQACLGDSIQKDRLAMLQCIALTNEFLASGARGEALKARAKSVSGIDSTFSNDGHFRVGPLGMDFDGDGRPISAAGWDTVYERIRKRGHPIPAQEGRSRTANRPLPAESWRTHI